MMCIKGFDAPFLLSMPTCKEALLRCSPGNFTISSSRGIGAVGQKVAIKHLADSRVSVQFSADGLAEIDLNELPFTGRVVVYSAGDIKAGDRDLVARQLAPEGMFPWFRGATFAANQTAHSRPVAFVSHDSRDKSEIVRPLVHALQRMMIPVWYDEYSLSVGDSLRGSIEAGLKSCPKCILVLTPQFLGKGGWTKREYDSVFTRELIEEQNLVLPVWCDVTRDQVYEFSPVLADRVGAQWSKGVDAVAKDLFRVLQPLASSYARADILGGAS